MLSSYLKSNSSKFFNTKSWIKNLIILISFYTFISYSAPKEDYPPLSEEKLAQFNEAKAALKELFQKELKEKIKRNPANKAQYKKDYEQSYNETLADLKRNYALGNIEIYREWQFPGISGTTPSGSGMSWAQVAVSGIYTFKDMYSNTSDAAAGLAFGLGNPNKYVGFSNSLDFQDLYDRDGSKRYNLTKLPNFSIGAYHLSIHRNFPGGFALGIGSNYLLTYGGEYTPSRINLWKSEHAVLTYYIPRGGPRDSFNMFQFTFGLGRGGQFVDDKTRVNKLGNVRGVIAPFFSFGVRALQPIGVGLEYGTKRVNAFMNITPFRSFPFALSLLAINLNGFDNRRKVLSVSGSFFYDFATK